MSDARLELIIVTALCGLVASAVDVAAVLHHRKGHVPTGPERAQIIVANGLFIAAGVLLAVDSLG